MAIHTYILDIEYNDPSAGYHPISVTAYKGTKREEIFSEYHGKSAKVCIRNVALAIAATEDAG